MTLKRRITGWLALLAVVLYGLTPLVAGLRPAGAAPLVCVTSAVHSCSCRLDPHSARECCCGDASKEKSCSLSRMPCDAGSAPEAVFPTAGNPLHLPVSSLRVICPVGSRLTRLPRVLRVATREHAPLTPPPQLQGATAVPAF